MRSPIVLPFLLLLLTIGALAKEEADEEESNAVHDEDEEGREGEADRAEAKDLSHGFGTDIEWVAWESAVPIALDLDKPILLLIHKTWCGACKALKKSFNTHSKRPELVELSRKFVMVNLEDDEEPEEDIYAPDGRYIPRLFILDKKGQPLAVDNKKNYPSNQQYFPQVPDVIKAMKKGLELFSGGQRKKEEPEKPVKDKGQAELKPPEDDDPKAGGCPHAAGKAAKKAKEKEEREREEKQKKTDKKEPEEAKQEKASKGTENAKKEGKKGDGAKTKSDKEAVSGQKKGKADKQKEDQQKKKKKDTKEEL